MLWPGSRKQSSPRRWSGCLLSEISTRPSDAVRTGREIHCWQVSALATASPIAGDQRSTSGRASPGHILAGKLAHAHEIAAVISGGERNQRIVPAPSRGRSLVAGEFPGVGLRVEQLTVETEMVCHDFIYLQPPVALIAEHGAGKHNRRKFFIKRETDDNLDFKRRVKHVPRTARPGRECRSARLCPGRECRPFPI